MNRMKLLAGLLLVLGWFLLQGCEDAVDLCGPQVPVGSIEGRVLTGGVPVSGYVRAGRIDEASGQVTRFDVEPDSTGHYAFDLPAGRYVVKLFIGESYGYIFDYTSTGPGWGQTPPDTLVIDGTRSWSGIDFELGGLTLDLRLSSHLDGEQGDVILHHRDLVDGAGEEFVHGGTATIEDGRLYVTVPGVLPGDYQVEVVLGARDYLCYCPFDGEHFWMPGTRDRAVSPWYTIGTDSAVHLEAAVATEPARIEGRISGAWLDFGMGYEPELAVFGPDSVLVMGSRRVESDGSFAVDVHIPGPVKLRVLQYGLEQWIGGPGFAEATVFDLALGETIQDVELVQSGIHFVLDGSLNLSWNTEFRIHDATGENLLATMLYDGGSSHHVGIPNLWPGEFLVYVTPSWDSLGWLTWRPQWWDRAVTAGEATRITLGSGGDIARLDLLPELGGTIAGTLVNLPPEDYSHYVYAVMVAGPEPGLTFRRQNFNGFEIRGLPDGDYRIGAVPWGVDFTGPETEGVAWYPGTDDFDQAEIVVIMEASNVKGIDFEIP